MEHHRIDADTVAALST